MWLVAGLGNPGQDYAGTRHNIGFLVAQRLVHHGLGSAWSLGEDRIFSQALASPDLLVIRPETYMNRSGLAVAAALTTPGTSPEQLVVIHDEVDLPFGTLRLKSGGGYGGHNGLKSIAESLGSSDFFRVRVGIGRPEAGALTHWVLGPWDSHQLTQLSDVVKKAADATLTLTAEGFTVAANRFNVRATPLDNHDST